MNTQERIDNLTEQMLKPENNDLKNKFVEFGKTDKSFEWHFMSLSSNIYKFDGYLDLNDSDRVIKILRNYCDYEGMSGFEFGIILQNVSNKLKNILDATH